MFKSPYDTTALSFLPVEKIQQALRLAKIEGRLVSASQPLPVDDTWGAGTVANDRLWLVVSGITGNQDPAFPPFQHPLSFTDTLGRLNMAIDLRAAVEQGEGGKLVIRNRNGTLDAQQLLIRLKACWAWLQNPESLLNVSTLGAQIYTRWLTENINRRLGLGPEAIPGLMVLSGWFYYCSFITKEQYTPQWHANTINRLTASLKFNQGLVSSVLVDAPYIADIRQFCQEAKAIIQVDQLALLDVKLVLQLAQNAWFGSAAKEAGAVALDYPPFFLSMLYGSLENRAYRNTALGLITERKEYAQLGKQFHQAFGYLINEV